MKSESDNEDTLIYDAEDGYIKSLEDLAAESIYDEKEKRPEVKESNNLPKAPDGGYGWIICCGVFLNHMIYGGLARSEGLFFLQFQSKFGSTAQLAAWPGSLMSTLNLFMGPLCGAIVSRYSERTSFIIGTTLCFLGMFLNAFAPNIYFLFVSHTLLGGLGRGMMTGILLLNLYFDKHRSLATGLGLSGVGIGSLWVVPLTQFLFGEYGFTGTFMILSALCLHGLVIAMLFRPLSMHYRFLKAKLLRKNLNFDDNEETVALNSAVDKNDNVSSTNQPEKNVDAHEISTKSDTFAITHENEVPAQNDSTLNHHVSTEKEEEAAKYSDLPYSTQPADDRISRNTYVTYSSQSTLPDTTMNELGENQKDNHYFLKSSLNICFPIELKRTGAAEKNKSFDWDLLRHVPFMVYCSGNFLYLLAFKSAFIFLPAIALSKGLSRQEAALLLTISGAFDTFGRISTGFIMDLRPMRPLRPYFFVMFVFFIAGFSLLMPSMTSFGTFSPVCAAYGFMTGGFITQKMVVLVDILGRERMPSSLGVQKVFQGFGTLIGPPIAGALRDILGSYDSSFYLGGASMLGAALMLTISTIMLKIRNKKLLQDSV